MAVCAPTPLGLNKFQCVFTCAVPLFFSSWHDGNDPTNPEIVGPVTTDELEQEERKLTPEEEKEQRMLEEHLEYQR